MVCWIRVGAALLFSWALSGAAAVAQMSGPPFPTSRFLADRPDIATTQLRLGRSFKATLKGGDVHRYGIRLDAGEFAAVRLPQAGGNLVAVLFAPDGAVLRIVDDNGAGQAEVVTIEAATAGDYHVQVAMFEWDAPDADYTIKWTRRQPVVHTPMERVQQLFESWYEPGEPGAVLLVRRNGETAYAGAIGIESMSGRRPLSLASPFDLASVSKQFTAYGVALLATSGRIRLEDDIRRYLPELPDYGAKITVQHLLEHTSGLRDWDGLFALTGRNIEDGITVDDVVAMAARQKSLIFTPGAEQRYSNTGYVLLAKIIERVTSEPFDSWMRRNVFAELGMRDCSFVRSTGVGARVASFRVRYPAQVEASKDQMVTMGSSGLACSANDLIRWMENYQSGRLGGPEVRRLVTGPPATPTSSERDYVFGNWLGERHGHAYVGHQGLAAGFRTSIRRFPADGLTVIYLANDGDDATYVRVRAVEAELFGVAAAAVEIPTDQYEPRVNARLSSEMAGQFLGRFRSDETLAEYEVLRSSTGIAMRQADETVDLTREDGDAFSTSRWYMPVVRFTRDASGIVSGFSVESEDVGALEFRRIKPN